MTIQPPDLLLGVEEPEHRGASGQESEAVAVHPRERSDSSGGISRRGFLERSAGTAAFISLAAFLDACANSTQGVGGPPGAGGGPSSMPLARPGNPVKWPIYPRNKAIASGLQHEKGATLQLYNWTDYIYKKVVNDFSKKYNVPVNLNTFNTMDEAVAKIQSGQLDFDVLIGLTPDVVGKLVESKDLRPLTHSYLPNISQVWPLFQNPFYDQGWQYTVPYTIYTTGIAWRTDEVKTDIASMKNPYDIFWDTAYKGQIEILDDYRESISMVLLRNGITNVNTCNQSQLNTARTQLMQIAQTMKPRVAVSDYSDLPQNRVHITQAWSGDNINSQYYGPKGFNTKVLRYWADPVHAPVNNDTMAVLSQGKNPVLAHLFLNYMLDYPNAMENFGWNGYQPPQTKVTASLLVKQGYVPPNLATAVVSPGIWRTGVRELELPPACDSNWHTIYSQFKAG